LPKGGVIRTLVGAFGAFLILVILWDGFETMILPRQVMRRVRLTRLFYRYTWTPWSRLSNALFSEKRHENFLSFYGPLSLLLLILVWAGVLIFGYGLLFWALESGLTDSGRDTHFLTNLYMSGSTFFTLGLGDVRPVGGVAKVITVIEAGMGFGFLALVVAYLPALNQSFSRREASISMLDARAGSPPTAGGLLKRCGDEGGLDYLRQQLVDYERWCAELMESHLSYPVLGYYRSQHDNQSWLAALTAILDTSALLLASSKGAHTLQAELTFAMARHTVVDLAAVFDQPPQRFGKDRLRGLDVERLFALLRSMGLTVPEQGAAVALQRHRESYEPYIHSLAAFFCFSVPPWIPDSDRLADWQTSIWEENPATPDDRDRALTEWEEHHFRK
jgi:hypothetical protein